MRPNYARRSGGERQYRPEQFKLLDVFRTYAPSLHIVLEYPILLDGRVIAIPDLVDLDNMIAYRLNGESHQGSRRIKDERQKLLLNSLGWKVIDIEKDSWDWNWLWCK